jgi:hypothetical protein
MTTKRMGGMGKLSDFGKSSKVTELGNNEVQAENIETAIASQPINDSKPVAAIAKDKQVSINIKITRTQQEWLADIAQLVRTNNADPVAPSDRVFPQHLIGVAIELLKASDIDWEKVKTVDDLRKHLNL